MIPVEPTFTVREVAGMLRVGKETVYSLVRARKLPCFRIGRNVRIPQASVYEFIRHSTIKVV